jgi:Zn-dependent protease
LTPFETACYRALFERFREGLLNVRDIDIGEIILYFVVFLFSLSFHEAAHAWTSERFGDETGRWLGRVSLNPIVHIDVFGTIIFPLIGLVSGGMMFGWAKPVPVDPTRWRNKRMANILVSAAGPLSNFLLATLSFIALKVLLETGTLGSAGGLWEPITKMLGIGLSLNILLAVFNLFPIPPLDGSHVLEEMLPPNAASAYEQLKPYGFILILGLVFLGVFSAVYNPIIGFVQYLLFL